MVFICHAMWALADILPARAQLSVSPTTARGVHGLFAVNKQAGFLNESEFGPFALIMAGAMNVGSTQAA